MPMEYEPTMNEPLTYEQIWGHPEDDDPETGTNPAEDFCPIRKTHCMYFDHGCVLDKCDMDSEQRE
jgi:hypothetical protein